MGTPHLQGYLQANHDKYSRFQNKVRGYYCKQKGTSDEAITYCKKDGLVYEAGVCEKIDAPKKRQGTRNDLESVKKAIENGESYDDICETHFGEAAKYGRFIKERIQAKESATLALNSRALFEAASLKPWQANLLAKVKEEPNPRKIYWIWSEGGNVGKSWMASYLAAMEGATILTQGKKADLAYIYAQKPTKIVCFDLSRTLAPEDGCKHSPLDVLYSMAEDLKNGRIVSTKYESTTKFFTVPHVIFFANYEPDRTKWSEDRYRVRKID
nr:MAG: replication associated protein [Cressdnaviricota sp.]